MFTLKNNSIGKVGITYEKSPAEQANDAAGPALSLDYAGNKAYKELIGGKFDKIEASNIEESKKLLVAANARILDKKSRKDNDGLPDLESRTNKLQASISKYEGDVAKQKSEAIQKVLDPLIVEPVLKQQTVEKNLVEKKYAQEKGNIVIQTQPKINTESEYAGTKAYESLKSGTFNIITPSNLEGAKKLLVASEARLKVIGKENKGYENMQVLTNKLAGNIQLFENIGADMKASGLESSVLKDTVPAQSIKSTETPSVETVVPSVNATEPSISEAKQDSSIDNIDGLKVDTLVAKIFDLPNDFFKGEITRVGKFQELMKVTAHLLKTGSDVPATEKDWSKLGYSGQGRFTFLGDKGELGVLKEFFSALKADKNKASLVQEIVTAAGNSEQGYKDVLRDRSSLLSLSANEKISSVSLDARGNIQNEKTDRVDALLGEKGWDTLGDKGAIEVSLKTAMTRGESLDSIYTRITGEKAPDWKSKGDIVTARVNFRDALTARMTVMKAIGGANAGLDAVLQGKDAQYISKIKEYVEKNGEITVKALDKSGMSDTLANSLSGILGLAVSVGTQGIITLRARGVETIKSDDILKKLIDDPKLEGSDKSALQWVANFFVGRRFAIDMGNGDAHDALKQRLINVVNNIKDIDIKTDPAAITDIGLRSAFTTAKATGLLDTPEGVQKFQKTVLEKAIVDNAYSEKDSVQYWASLNPLFFGIHRDGVDLKMIATEASTANKIELDATLQPISLSKLGISSEEGGKKFIIPSTINDGVINNVPVVIMNSDGTLQTLTEPLSRTFDKSQSVKLSRITNEGQPVYILSFIDSVSSAPAAVVTKKVTVDNSADLTNAVSLATGRESFKGLTLGGSIYVMARTHGKYPYFDRALAQASNQDYSAALATLKNAKNSKVAQALYKMYANNPDGLATALTFKYGGVEKNAKADKFGKLQYNKSREAGVIRAENKLAGSNPTTKEMEAEFKNLPSHKATELNSILPGQALAVSVYATPKGGQHTIDKFEGSIQVSQHTIDITNPKAKGEIFDRHTKTNIKQLEALNKGLADDKKLNMAEFRALVVDGTLPGKLEGVSIVKPAQFKEARAMIQGNLCTNKVEVIAYPVIAGQVVPPVESLDVASVGMTTVLENASVRTTETDVGINPVAAAIKKINERKDGGPEPEKPNAQTDTGTDVRPTPGSVTSTPGATTGEVPGIGQPLETVVVTPPPVATVVETVNQTTTTVNTGGGFIPPG